MLRECPGCGAKTAALEARFCRRCGAPLKTADGNATVSPVAPTVPLADQGRATDGLVAEESHRLADQTSRIKRAEMEELLRRVALDHSGDGRDSLPLTQAADEPPHAAETIKAAGDGNSSSSVDETLAQAASAPSRAAQKRWRVLALVVLCVALAGVALAVIAIRRSRASNAAGPTAPPPSEATQPVAQAEEAAPQIEPLTITTPPPVQTPSPAPSPSQRVRETEAAAHPPTAGEATSVPLASPAPSVPAPDAGETTTPPAPPTISPAEHYQRGVQLWATDRRAALEEFRAAVPAVTDAYYYLGAEHYSEGRDVKTLSDGELRAALNYFTRVTSGPHSGQASRYVQALGKEYDRRKKQSRP